MANILIIDDDQSLLQMMSLILERMGHNPILASKAMEGIKMAQDLLPDMAIIDLMMPDVSGFEVSRILRENPQTKDIPLLILTAVTQEESRELARQSGADDFLTKPVTKESLADHIEDLMKTGARTIPAPRTEDNSPSAAKTALSEITIDEVREAIEQRYELLPLTAVMGLSSGVGASTIAINLSLGAMQYGRSCLFDMRDFGNVAAQLNLTLVKGNWGDIVGIRPRDPKSEIGAMLTLDHPSGVAVVASPGRKMGERLSEAGLYYTLSVLSEGFARITALLPSDLNEMAGFTLQFASNIVLVVGDDPAALRNASDALMRLNQLEFEGEQHIVLNRTRPHGVSHEEVMSALNRPITATIPYEPQQIDALQTGRPLVMLQPESLFARSIIRLARQL